MTQRRISFTPTAFLAAAILASGLAGPAGRAEAQQPELVSGGHAFGTFVSLADVAQTQKSSLVGMGCSVAPLFKQNSAPSVDLAPIGTVGQIRTTVERINTGSMVRGRSTAEIEEVSLLGGVITADVLKAVAVTKHTSSGFGAHATGTQFLNANVLGLPIDLDPPQNTVIELPLFGEVALNERARVVRNNRAAIETTMLRVSISLPNVLGIPVGTEVIVGDAQSKMKFTSVRLGGGVTGGAVTLLDDTTLLGPLFPQGMWCAGTDGEWLSNAGVTVGLPGIVDTGEIESKVKGDTSPTSSQATGISTIAGADLLAGLVSVEAIKGRVHIERTPSQLVRKFWQSGFVGLQVAGFPEIDGDVPFETHLDILGLGDLWLKRRVFWPNGAQIRMIELVVLEENGLGLPLGASVRVGVATLSARPF